MSRRVLVTEEIAERGLDLLRSAGFTVDVQLGLDPQGLRSALVGAHALIIRSATQVDAEALAAGTDLMAVGRAGIGLDNVDVAEATRRGVMVINAPTSNILSTAEHTMAMLLASARNVPQAHRDLTAGRWNRSQWEGVELHGKTLGVLGLGRVGTLVAQRALAFGMTLVAYDPYVSPDRARRIGVRLVDSVAELVAESDFLTIHTVKTPETVGLIGTETLAHAKANLRVINVARGGIVDEDALAGLLGGAPVIRAPGRAHPVTTNYLPVPGGTTVEQATAAAVAAARTAPPTPADAPRTPARRCARRPGGRCARSRRRSRSSS